MTVKDYLLEIKAKKLVEEKLGMSTKELKRKLDEEMNEKIKFN